MSDDRLRIAEASVRIDGMPAEGRDIIVEPSVSERASVAEAIGVTSVDRLSVKLHADRFRGGFRVVGKISATITQPSVVSLDPVTQDMDEAVDRVFLPGGEKEFAAAAGAEVFVDLEGEDMPDHFEGNEADLSELIIETVALAVDLYPRLPGESLPEVGDGAADDKESPFAVLAALKRDKE